MVDMMVNGVYKPIYKLINVGKTMSFFTTHDWE